MATSVEDIEVAEEFEAGVPSLQSFDNKCKKAVGHSETIPVGEFTMDNLPPAWQYSDLWINIMIMAVDVVKIRVSYISERRPNNYAFHQHRGTPFHTCGSGQFDTTLLKDLMKKTPMKCPLEHCNKAHPHEVTPIFEVYTATHVVFDDAEAENATVQFFYNCHGSHFVTAEVVRVEFSKIEVDQCRLCCVCHDLELFKKFILHGVACVIWAKASLKLSYSSMSEIEKSPLVVVVGHPHGCPKHISIGEWVGYKERSVYCDFRLRDTQQFIENNHLNWELNGGALIGDTYVSSNIIRKYQRLVEANPDITVGEFYKSNHVSLVFDFITYTAATCPGTSDGRVMVCLEEEDRRAIIIEGGSHFRGKEGSGKCINFSGGFGFRHAPDLNMLRRKYPHTMKFLREEQE